MMKKLTKLSPSICWYVTFECFGSAAGSLLDLVFTEAFQAFHQRGTENVMPMLDGGEHDPGLVSDIAWKAIRTIRVQRGGKFLRSHDARVNLLILGLALECVRRLTVFIYGTNVTVLALTARQASWIW